MITSSSLGTRGRLGNQLFQYAFLRTSAQRLGVQFYCPPWIGDRIFELNDQDERAQAPSGITSVFVEPVDRPGFNVAAGRVTEGTDVHGYFQTEKYFDRQRVLGWYRFRDDAIASVRDRHGAIDFSNCVGVHMRLGDYVAEYSNQYYVPRRDYYLRALQLVSRPRQVVVFSDDVPSARVVLGALGTATIFIENSEPYEDLFLQSQCRDFICSPSTLSWWGAWLNGSPGKVVVAPSEGPLRPGARVRPPGVGFRRMQNSDYWPAGWLTIPALRPWLDHRAVVTKVHLADRAVAKLRRAIVRWVPSR